MLTSEAFCPWWNVVHSSSCHRDAASGCRCFPCSFHHSSLVCGGKGFLMPFLPLVACLGKGCAGSVVAELMSSATGRHCRISNVTLSCTARDGVSLYSLSFSYTWVIMPMPIWHLLSVAVWPFPWLIAVLHKFLAIALASI